MSLDPSIPPPMRPLRQAAAGALAACLALAGCQPLEQTLAPTAPAALVAPGGPTVFAAPPAPSAQGVVVDPFAPPYPQAMPPGVAPVVDPADGGASRIHVPVVNRDWTWEQIVDVVDDYFRIERERQVQTVGDVITEGRIDAYPLVGATIVEPHRRDSVGRYNRWESTFQTIRRRAAVRVIPEAGGYVVDVTVEKDLEDLARPEHATAGAAVFRNDNSLPSIGDRGASRTRLSGNWILLGRDQPLERQILADIQERLTPQAPAAGPYQ